MQSRYAIDGGEPTTFLPPRAVQVEAYNQTTFYDSGALPGAGEHTLKITNLAVELWLDYFLVDGSDSGGGGGAPSGIARNRASATTTTTTTTSSPAEDHYAVRVVFWAIPAKRVYRDHQYFVDSGYCWTIHYTDSPVILPSRDSRLLLHIILERDHTWRRGSDSTARNWNVAVLAGPIAQARQSQASPSSRSCNCGPTRRGPVLLLELRSMDGGVTLAGGRGSGVYGGGDALWISEAQSIKSRLPPVYSIRRTTLAQLCLWERPTTGTTTLENVPLRIPVPAFHSWSHWIAADNKQFSYLAIYDIDSTTTINGPPYSSLADTRSDREEDIIHRLALLDRRAYSSRRRVPPVVQRSAYPTLLNGSWVGARAGQFVFEDGAARGTEESLKPAGGQPQRYDAVDD
ncbi:hypothetical protein LXA43DRAFT_1097719 [Ganoderma leucocontextum]|nr:hypothetical protein LXA43DRAFT_1097719 [Ganoderma leucocontextum]